MITFEKLLLLLNTTFISEVKDYFTKDGFILQSCSKENCMWVKPIRTDKAEVISLMQMEGAHKSVSYIFFDEDTYHNFLRCSMEELGFQILENGDAKVLGTNDYILIATRREHAGFISFSIKLATRNKDGELIKEVIITPPVI